MSMTANAVGPDTVLPAALGGGGLGPPSPLSRLSAPGGIGNSPGEAMRASAMRSGGIGNKIDSSA